MSLTEILGILLVSIAGLVMGSAGWPIKIMRKFQYEHWGFVYCLFGIVILPWIITMLFCPHALTAYGTIDRMILLKSNLWSMGWGVANVLCGLCFVRIGFSLTGGILTGLGVSLGVAIPMVFKASGLFKNAPDLTSPAGLAVLAGVAVMVIGVVLVSLAGFGRDKVLGKLQSTSGNFGVGFIMAIIAGVLSCGISFAFVYSQGPIVEAMKAQGAKEIPANFSVWAVGLLGGAAINVLYPAYLMTKHKSWHVLRENINEVFLSLIMGVNFCVAVSLMGKGMLMLGVLGASVGFGVQQAMQMAGTQGVGFISGEWRGVSGTPRRQIYYAITVLIVAALIMAYGNSLTTS
jgi:L-rhamnose-H+ transport protein